MPSYTELFRYIWQFIRLQKWIFLTIFILDCFTWSLDALIWPYILHVVIDIFTRFEANRTEAWQALQAPIIAGLCLVTYVESSSRTMGFLMAKAMPLLQSNIRLRMFDHVQHHSPKYFNERFAGALTNKINDMTTQVDSILQQLFWPIVPAASTCILGSFFLWSVHPLFAGILLIWLIIHLAICIQFTRRVDVYEHDHSEKRSTLIGKIVDSLTNNFAVNLFFRFAHEKKFIQPYQDDERISHIKAKTFVVKMQTFLSIFYFLGGVVAVNGMLIYLWLHNQISTGQVVQVFTTMWSLAMILWSIGNTLPILFQSCGIAKQAYSVLLDPQDLGDQLQAKQLKTASGQIIFDKVTFNYGKKQLFQDQSVTIHAHEKIGLVGYTGAGKSTFVNLILRFYSLTSGRILIDNQDIATVSLESLRNQIALIPQDPQLFHRSLKENIAYGKPGASDAEIYQAAKFAHCDEFIRNIPNGYDAKVGERGTKLSGGEKQRIAIARAILANAPILILDEATSSLDSLTEKYIQDSLEKLIQNRTTIIIAHRLSTLARMDRILVFDQGKIVEQGSPQDLIAQNGLYAKMWNMQVGGFLPEGPTNSNAQ